MLKVLFLITNINGFETNKVTTIFYMSGNFYYVR